MRFNEFIEFIEKKYKEKILELEKEKDNIGKQYDILLTSHHKMKPPIFKKKHPSGYLIAGITCCVVLLALITVLIKIFPLVPKGVFIIPASLVAAISSYAGYEITRMSKSEKGEESIRYTEFQKKQADNQKELSKLLERRSQLNNAIWDANKRLEGLGITACKECYTYLIPSSLKGKDIIIDEKVLDKLLKSVPLNVIIYKYYYDELESFAKLSRYEQERELVKLNLEYKAHQIKSKVQEELEKQKMSSEPKQKSMVQKNDANQNITINKSTIKSLNVSNTISLKEIPYQRKRRTERNMGNYHSLENEVDKNKEISHLH